MLLPAGSVTLNRNSARSVESETAKVFARPKLLFGDAVEMYVSATAVSVTVVDAATAVLPAIVSKVKATKVAIATINAAIIRKRRSIADPIRASK